MLRPAGEMTEIPPDILKRYYEASYGRPSPPQQAFADTTFEQYFALQRIVFPKISRRQAALNSPRFRELASEFPEEPKEAPPRVPGVMVQRRPQVDLRTEPLGPETGNLVVDRVKSVSGLEALRRPRQLKKLHMVLCGGPDQPALDPVVAVEELFVVSLNAPLERAVLKSTAAVRLQIEHDATPVFDLRVLGRHQGLEQLRVFAGFIRGLGSLAQLPLETLFLSNVAVDDEFRSALSAMGSTLSDFGVGNPQPFAPSALPNLPALRRLTVPAYPDSRHEWIEFAVSHPRIGCLFPPVQQAAAKAPKAELAELFRGVDILRVEKGKKVAYEVSGDLAGRIVKSRTLDNGALEDRLQPVARKAKKKIAWSSEAGTFVAQTDNLETARWIIDAIHELKG